MISVQKLAHVIKSNTTKRQQENKPREFWLKTTVINMDKGGIDQKGYSYNSGDLRNAIGPYSQILEIEKIRENILK